MLLFELVSPDPPPLEPTPSGYPEPVAVDPGEEEELELWVVEVAFVVFDACLSYRDE